MFHVEHFALVMEDGLKNMLDVPCGTLAEGGKESDGSGLCSNT